MGFPSTTEGSGGGREFELAEDCDGLRTAFGADVADSTARIVDVDKNGVAPDAGVTVNSVSAKNSVLDRKVY